MEFFKVLFPFLGMAFAYLAGRGFIIAVVPLFMCISLWIYVSNLEEVWYVKEEEEEQDV